MANIDDMTKLSEEKKGVFSTLASMVGDKVADVKSAFEGDPREIYNRCQKFASMNIEGLPSDFREPLEIFQNATMFNSEILSKLDKKTLSNISALVDTLETLVGKVASFKGEKTPLNKDYADIQKAFREYAEIVTKYDDAVISKTVVNSATIEQQNKDLDIDSRSREIDELITAFSYMGMKVMPDGNGSYTSMEIPDSGVPYVDASGKTQYIRISRETTQEFIDGYLKTGGLSCAKEEENLKIQNEILTNMEANQKEGGFYAPDNDEILAQKKEVEKAKKALAERQAQRISKKGLYAYFLKELKANTSRTSRNKGLMRAVEEKFSINSPEEQLFSIKNNPNIAKDDMMRYALHAIKKEDMEALSVDEDSAFVDNANSKFATGFRNSGRLENILDDIAETNKSAEQVAKDNEQAMDDIVSKYTTIASKLEILSASYKGSPREAELKREARECRSIARSIEGFASAVSAISDEIIGGNIVAPKEVSSIGDAGSAKLVSAIMDAVEISDGVISVTKDLTDKDGNVWLSQSDLDAYLQSGMVARATNNSSLNASQDVSENEDEEEHTYNPECLPNVLAYSLDHEISEGVTVNDVLSKDAMYDRVVSLIDIGDNLIADMFNDFKGRDITASEFIDMLKGQGADLTNGFYGIADTEVFAHVFDYCKLRDAEKEKDPKAEVSMEEKCEGFADAKKQADMGYYYIDSVALAIYEDEKAREKFEKAKPSERQKIFAETLKRLKDNGLKSNPESEVMALARARWANHYNMAHLQNLVENGLGELCESGDKNSEQYQRLTNAVLESYKRREREQRDIDESLKSNNEAVVDREETPTNEATNENGENEEEEAKLRKFGEIFPRGTPANKIAKMLQPYNIKVGKKFLDQMIDAFKNVMVKDPFDSKIKNSIPDLDSTSTKKKDQASDGKDADDKKQEESNDTKSADGGEDKTKEESQKQDATAEKSGGKPVFEGYTSDRIRARVAMVSVGMGISSIMEQVQVEKENADLIKSAMEYMTLYDQPQPSVSINVNGRTSQLILADAMQYVFLNEFASGNKSAEGVEDSIDAITAQLGENKQLINMVNSIKPLMGAITPAEIVNLVRMTAKVQVPQPGEPMSIDLGSNLSQEDIAKFQQAKSFDELRDMVVNTKNVYNQDLVNQIMQTEQLRKSPEYQQAKAHIDNGEMIIN